MFVNYKEGEVAFATNYFMKKSKNRKDNSNVKKQQEDVLKQAQEELNNKAEPANEVKKSENEEKQNDKDNKKDESKREDESLLQMIIRETFEWIMCIVIAFALAVTIKYFVFTPTLVKQSSMYPTIFDGERVFVNRLARTFKLQINRGDIITLEAPSGSISQDSIRAYYVDYKGAKWFTYEVLEIGKISYIKRVIGIAGDTIKIEDGKVYLNGELLDESAYLPDGTETYISDTLTHIKNEFTVPEGYVFAMGDNRSYSRDCRELGCIPIEKVEGKVLFRLWPLSKFGGIKKSDITKEEVDKYDDDLQRFKL